MVYIPLVRMLFNGYICCEHVNKFGWEAIRIYKRATNQSLNQKSRCFYIGAFVLAPFSSCDMAV